MKYQRTAFATIVAIFMLGLLTATLMGLVAVSQSQFRRTVEAQQKAQLRQLLLAGSIDAIARMKNWNPAEASAHSWTIESPEQQASVKVNVQEATTNRIDVQMDANSTSHQMRQALVFERNATGWQPVEAELQ
jgi:hypothetical protein